MNTIFRSNVSVLKNPDKLLNDVLADEKGMVTIDSKFKPINIGNISDDDKYIGNGKKCEEFINEMPECNYQDIYVDRTICKEYKINDLSDAIFFPSYHKVEY